MMQNHRLVIVESPYAGNIELNLRYLRACLHDCLMRGEAPYASHGLYTQPGVLRDDVPEERTAGIEAGFSWRQVADATVVYMDLGTSKGMQYGIDAATKRIHDEGSDWHKIEYRALGAPWSGTFDDGSGSYEQDAVESEGAQSYFATSRWTGK